MAATQELTAQELRTDAAKVMTHLQAGQPVTMLDARSDKAWETSLVKIRGASRVQPTASSIDPAWPKGQLTVVY